MNNDRGTAKNFLAVQQKRQKMKLSKENIDTLKNLAEWLEDQQYRPYQPEFNQRCAKWQDTIENIIEEARENEPART